VSSCPDTPRTVPGAIVAVDPVSALSRVAAFPYNPDQVTQTFRRRAPAGGSGQQAPDVTCQVLRLTGHDLQPHVVRGLRCT
jgi:hypothetical protein